MKKKLLLIFLVVICVSSIAHSTVAYFTTEDTAHNVITSGGVDISVVEWQLKDGERVPYPENTPIVAMPTQVVSKIPTVVSSEKDTYIRAAIDITVKDPEGNVMPLEAEDISRIISLNIDSENWLAKDPADGWYYYKTAVGDGNATEPIFNEVTFSAEMDNEYQLCTVEIDINAQGVQAANNGESVLDAAGWE